MEDFVTVATYLTLADAEPPRLALEEAGIRAMATDEAMGNLLTPNMIGGIKLQVAAADTAKARNVLAEFHAQYQPETGDEEDEEEEADDGLSFKCPKCGAEIWFPEDSRGEAEVCPECGTNVTVPNKPA